jgi:carbon-monoxide dehydrogenase medium subunit
MITAEFDYQAPDDLHATVQLLQRDAENTKILAGGMTLMPMLNLGLLAPNLLIGLRQVSELNGVTEDTDTVSVGSMTRHHTVSTDPLILRLAPLLGMAAMLIGDVQVRNRGTIGGSLAHADPAANYLPAVVALDAEIELAGPSGRRSVPARAFFCGVMATQLEHDEVIVSVRIPKAKSTRGYGFQKFARVKGNFPIVCAAALANGADAACRVVIGGASAVPVAIEVPAEDTPGDGVVADMIRAAIEDPLEDQNGDAEYKREMAVVFGMRALADARANAHARRQRNGK